MPSQCKRQWLKNKDFSETRNSALSPWWGGFRPPALKRRLELSAGPGWDRQPEVAQESPQLYFEIQALNDYGAESLEALAKAVESIRRAVLAQDPETFSQLMERGREYLEDRRNLTAKRA